MVDILLHYDVARNALNNRGQTPLHYAAFSHHGALCMELLVKAGANPNIQDMDGRTPLHMTALHGFYLRTETLIGQGLCLMNRLGGGGGGGGKETLFFFFFFFFSNIKKNIVLGQGYSHRSTVSMRATNS